ncbi:DUF2141 domain-containing protein [Aquaticitalea lipolytica]|jgi:uncharacterized protein (DUF2141 family)|uniref:DUF2141 domain-containing protein n=1 Tax=Aquaticitalea lipolytica TaxID=1247562 RepID=UPI0024B99149|nr:DUF2141 domain-containing protein [Aquaticitalea lipolytica]|tara:strand:+ start:94 stop:519 length:426 start_codon:yes stop_codon:yes gene_type:complete
MKIIAKLILLLLMSITNVNAQETTAQDVVVKITNFDTNKGKVFIALYNSETSFLGTGFKSIITSIENNACTVTFKDVPQGIYAISLFHDENGNNKMDSNFLGIPKEDYACSNNAKGFMGPPKWEDAKFEVKNETINQTIKL